MKRYIAIAGLTGLCGCVVESNDNNADGVEIGQSKEAIISGYTPAGTDNMAKMVVKYNAGQGLCSGTLINSTWVLTAAHCVYDTNWGFTLTSSTGSTSTAWQVIRHPNAKPVGQVATASMDVALIELTAPLGTVYAGYWPSSVMVNQNVSCYGYGYNTFSNTGDGILRTAILPVSDTSGLPDTGSSTPYSGRYTLRQNSNWQTLAHGDSGGPCFANGFLTGVQSTVYMGSIYWYSEQTKMSYIWQWVRDTAQ